MPRFRKTLSGLLGPKPKGRTVSIRSRGGGRIFDPPQLRQNKLEGLQELLGQFFGGQGAPEARFAQLKKRQQLAAKRARQALKNVGQAERRRIGERGEQAQAIAAQQRVSSGLGNTTIAEMQRRGIQSDVQRAQSDLAERLAVQRSGLEERLGRFEIDTLLSREDRSPDVGQFLSLIRQFAAAGGL